MTSDSGIEEFGYGKFYQVIRLWYGRILLWLTSVIRFWHGRILLGLVLSGSGMGECCNGKRYQVVVLENFVMISVIRFWYERILLW